MSGKTKASLQKKVSFGQFRIWCIAPCGNVPKVLVPSRAAGGINMDLVEDYGSSPGEDYQEDKLAFRYTDAEKAQAQKEYESAIKYRSSENIRMDQIADTYKHPAREQLLSVMEKFLHKHKPEHEYKASYLLDKYLGREDVLFKLMYKRFKQSPGFDLTTLASPGAQALVLSVGIVQAYEALHEADPDMPLYDEDAPALPAAAAAAPTTLDMMDLGSPQAKDDKTVRCVRLTEGDPIVNKVPDYSEMFNSSVSNARQALKIGLTLPPSGVVCKSKNQTIRDGRDVYYYLSVGPGEHTPTPDEEERTSLTPRTSGGAVTLSSFASKEKQIVKMTILRLEDGHALIKEVPDYSEKFNNSVTIAQQQIKQGLALPASGVVCLSSNKSKAAKKPVYFYLSSGTGLTPRKRRKHREMFTLPEELRSRTYDNLNLAKDKDVSKLMASLNETVVFSGLLIKFNERNKRQERVLMVSSQAVYNYGPKRYRTPKTRIEFGKIVAVTQTSMKDTHEFVLHVPSQHDYRFHDPKSRRDMLYCLTKAYAATTGKELRRNYSRTKDLAAVCIIKTMNKDKRGAMMQLQTKLDTRPPEELMRDAQAGDTEFTGWAAENKPAAVSLKDFTLTKVIGRGSFGKVYLAKKKTAPGIGNFYALKVLNKKVIKDRDQVEHTLAERKVMETISHPFLMKLHYAFQNSTRLYFVMDYLPGGEIFFHLSKHRFGIKKTTFYVAEIALGLGHLHDNNIIYRDLKPENILLDAGGHVRITDFGLAKGGLTGSSTTDTFCGTPEYLAPEVIHGKGHGKPVDWWSLGILTFEMLVGCPPFYHANVQIMYSKIISEPVPQPGTLVSGEAKKFILALLNRNVATRLGSAGGIAEIRKHAFFSAMNWDALYDKKIKPPFIPKLKGTNDTSFVAQEFLDERVVDTPETETAPLDDDGDFNDFEFSSNQLPEV